MYAKLIVPGSAWNDTYSNFAKTKKIMISLKNHFLDNDYLQRRSLNVMAAFLLLTGLKQTSGSVNFFTAKSQFCIIPISVACLKKFWLIIFYKVV